MRRSLLILPSLIIMLLANWAMAAIGVGESLNYVLNKNRSTWLINSGSGTAKVMEYLSTGEYGPGFVIRINYELNVTMRGKQTGEMDIFVPERVFDRPQFLADLAKNHPMSMGSFMVDYHGMSSARDARGTMYDQCAMTRIYDINPMYKPMGPDSQEAAIMRFDHKGSISSVTNLQIRMKVADGVPVLGAVQIDLSGISDMGLPFDIGMDMMPR